MATLAKINQDTWLGGVCSGFAYYVGIPAWIIRLAIFALFFCKGGGLGVYILLWIFLPRWDQDPEDYWARTCAMPGKSNNHK